MVGRASGTGTGKANWSSTARFVGGAPCQTFTNQAQSVQPVLSHPAPCRRRSLTSTPNASRESHRASEARDRGPSVRNGTPLQEAERVDDDAYVDRDAASLELDHVLIAVPDLNDAAWNSTRAYGLVSVEGGRHPEWGTANRIVPVGDAYLELVALVDRERALGNPFGRWVAGVPPGPLQLLGWAVRTPSIDTIAVAARSHRQEGIPNAAGWTDPRMANGRRRTRRVRPGASVLHRVGSRDPASERRRARTVTRNHRAQRPRTSW